MSEQTRDPQGGRFDRDPDTGRLKWYFQHAPGESFDMDEVFERVLVDLDGRKLLFTVGKPGILWKIDRET